MRLQIYYGAVDPSGQITHGEAVDMKYCSQIGADHRYQGQVECRAGDRDRFGGGTQGCTLGKLLQQQVAGLPQFTHFDMVLAPDQKDPAGASVQADCPLRQVGRLIGLPDGEQRRLRLDESQGGPWHEQQSCIVVRLNRLQDGSVYGGAWRRGEYPLMRPLEGGDIGEILLADRDRG